MASLAGLLLDHPATDDEPLLHTIRRTVTAGEARRSAHELARALRDAGVERGMPVAVARADGPDVTVAMIAVWLAGGVYVPLNPRAPEAEHARAIDAARPAAVVREGVTVPMSGAMVHPDDTALVQWTSGTTGAPKAILHTATAYLEILDRVLTPLRGKGNMTGSRPMPNLIPVSMSLNAGIYNALFGLRAGAELVFMDKFATGDFAALVRRFGVRSTVLPPAALTMLADDPAVSDLTPLRYVRSITAPLSPLQAGRFTTKFGVTVLNGYGQAEIGEVIGWTAADAKAHPEKVGAAGRPHAGVDVKIAGGAEIGELLVRPPSMAAGYATGEALADRIDGDGFVHTGDIARIDPDGFVWIEGRVSDVINRGGNKISPEQVEEVLRLHPSVTDAAVVGVGDDRLGEVPVAFVVGVPVPDDQLVEVCRRHLTAYKIPAAFEWLDALPVSEAGKVLRRTLADLATARGAGVTSVKGAMRAGTGQPAGEHRSEDNPTPV